MKHIAKLVFLFVVLAMPMSLFSQAKASGYAYYLPNRDFANIVFTPVGGIKGVTITVTGIDSNLEKVIYSGQDIFRGSKFTFNDLPVDTKLKFKIQGKCLNGNPALYDYEFTIPKGIKYFDLGSFVYIVSESRWVPKNTIK